MLESMLLDLPKVPPTDLPAEGWGDWVLTRIGQTLDGTMLQAMGYAVDALLLPRPEHLPQLRASAEPLLKGELWSTPRAFFDFVDHPVAPLDHTARFRRTLRGGVAIAREFTTGYRPYAGLEPHMGVRAAGTDTLLVEHWMHEPQNPTATVVALHGFTMGYPRMDAFAMFAGQFFERGFDVALVTLPFHGRRTPKDARFSGERFAVPHVAKLADAARQAIYETHLLLCWLRKTVDAPVGLLGLSLGGYLSSLMAGLTDDLDFVVPMVPPVCIGDLAWRFFSTSRARGQGDAPAYTLGELRAMYRVHSPLTFPLRVERRRALIIAGRGDRIVPPEHPHALWEHWGRPAIHWFSGSHLAPFGRDRIVAAVVDHLRGLDIL